MSEYSPLLMPPSFPLAPPLALACACGTRTGVALLGFGCGGG
jgi:hypothetical protein